MKTLYRGQYREKKQEYITLKEKILGQTDTPEMRYFLKLSSEILEMERFTAQVVGMAVGLHLDKTLRGELEATLREYCECELDDE